MYRNKIVTDYKTLLCSPEIFVNLTNTVIYISKQSIELYKQKFNENMNTPTLNNSIKNTLLKEHTPIIKFIKNNNTIINNTIIQSDELPFIHGNNSAIVIVGETKDARLFSKSLAEEFFEAFENEVLYIALTETAEIYTIYKKLIDKIDYLNIPVSYTNAYDI